MAKTNLRAVCSPATSALSASANSIPDGNAIAAVMTRWRLSPTLYNESQGAPEGAGA